MRLMLKLMDVDAALLMWGRGNSLAANRKPGVVRGSGEATPTGRETERQRGEDPRLRPETVGDGRDNWVDLRHQPLSSHHIML